jgi:cellulose synthase operon protein C
VPVHARAATGWSLAASLLLTTCRGGAGDGSRAGAGAAAPPLAFEPSGCAVLEPGPRCVPNAERSLRLLVPAPPAGTTLRVSAGAGSAAIQTTTRPSDGGQLLSLILPPGTAAIAIEAVRPGGAVAARARLPLAALPAAVADGHRLRRSGDVEGAARALAAAESSLPPAERGRVLTLRGRLALQRNDPALAERTLGEAIAAHRQRGHLPEAADDAMVLAYIRLQYGDRFTEARQALDTAFVASAGYPDGRAQVPYVRGLVAKRTGDVRAALAHLRDAEARTGRLGLAATREYAREELIDVLQQLGRWPEADRLIDDNAREPGPAEHPCHPADRQNNRAWALLRAREAGTGAADGARRAAEALARARDLLSGGGGCLDPGRRANVHLNLALAALHAGDQARARAELTAARAALPEPTADLTLWSLDLEGRIALAQRRWRQALGHYRRLEPAAAAVSSHPGRWRAALGRARALAGQGDRRGAAAAYAEAEALLDDERFSIPLTEGRETFLAQREESARELASLLLAQGRPAEALQVARNARRRVLASLRRADQIGQLAGPARARWESALAAYQRERAAIEADAARDWQWAAEGLARAQQARAARAARLRETLDAAFQALAGRAARRPGDPGEAFAPPAPGEVLLAYFPGADGWIGFAARADAVIARPLGTLPALLPAGPDTDRALGRALLDPFAAQLRGAPLVRVLPYGALRDVDFQALRPAAGDRPLLATTAVVHPLDLPDGAAARAAAAASPPRALVVANPRGDLPHAATEGALVKRTLEARPGAGDVTMLSEGQATRAGLLATLPQVGLFHYAGHAELVGAGGWDSALPLAGSERLTVGDILTLPVAPRQVVLSGCETGRVGNDAAVEAMGLAHAFLVAGADSVVAAARPVRDDVASELVAAFYRASASGAAPAEALRRAQWEFWAKATYRDWAAFRLFTR